MKVILFNRSHNSIGGDAIQVENYIKSLKKLGHDAIYSRAMFNVPTADEHWLFHVNFGWTDNQAQSLKSQGKEYCLFAIFYPHVFDNSVHKMRELINDSKMTFCLSENERDEMISFLNIGYLSHKIKVITNAVDKDIFNPVGEKYGEDYVISVGRFEDNKGLKEVVEASRLANRKVKIIGCFGDKRYYKEMIDDGVEVYANLSQEELAKHYRSARIYLCASKSDRNALTVLESIACGSKAINSRENRGHLQLENVPVINPFDIEEMADAINKMWDKPFLQSVYSWDEVVCDILRMI